MFQQKIFFFDFSKKIRQFLIFFTIFCKHHVKNRKFSKFVEKSNKFLFCLNTSYNTEKDIYSPIFSSWTCLVKIVGPIETSKLARAYPFKKMRSWKSQKSLHKLAKIRSGAKNWWVDVFFNVINGVSAKKKLLGFFEKISSIFYFLHYILQT